MLQSLKEYVAGGIDLDSFFIAVGEVFRVFLFIVVSDEASVNEKLVRMLVIFFMEFAKKLGVVVLLALWWERCSFHRLNRVFTAQT